MRYVEFFNRLDLIKTEQWTNITKQHMAKHT